jgi:hypothetical protein
MKRWHDNLVLDLYCIRSREGILYAFVSLCNYET